MSRQPNARPTTTTTQQNDNDESDTIYNMKEVGLSTLPIIRYRFHDTLQGYIHLSYHPNYNITNDQTPIIIKQTFKALINDKKDRHGRVCDENYFKEIDILKYLSSQNDIDDGICKLIKNINNEWMISEDVNNYYYAVQFCQCDVFKYISDIFDVKNNGKQIKLTKNNKQEWINNVQCMFQQICRCVNYLHFKGIAHRDLSLENVMVYTTNNGYNWIKIIDFGVALDISNNHNSWRSHGRIGKTDYMAPEVYNDDIYPFYDARCNDIWCLGVILFAMLTGVQPYQRHKECHQICLWYLVNGQIKHILNEWNKLWLVNDDAVDLMDKIFKFENKRITMDKILCHSFVNLTIDQNEDDEDDGKYPYDNEDDDIDIDVDLIFNSNYNGNQQSNNHYNIISEENRNDGNNCNGTVAMPESISLWELNNKNDQVSR